MTQGNIVEYVEQGQFICAFCLEDKGNRFHLLNASNREISLAAKRAVLVSESNMNPRWPREELLARLKEKARMREHLKAQVDAKELWELVRDENEVFDNRYLAHLAFGDTITEDHRSAVVRALFENRLYFKMKDGHFLPNPEDKIEQILKQRQAEALRAERLREGGRWLRAIREGQQPQDPPCRDAVIQDLIELALYGTDAPDLKYKKELLSNAGIHEISEVRALLVRLGVWEEDQNRDLLRLGIETTFTPDQLAEASRLAGLGLNRAGREDLRTLPCITIDGAFTRDYDDAMSVEMNGDDIRIGIHIADVAAAIQPGSPMDHAAKARASSHYLPRRQIPMIPEVLSQDALSLKQGGDRPALSLLATFDKEGVLKGHRFTPSIINVQRQLCYTDVDDTCEAEDDLKALLALSQSLRQQRIAQGAMSLSLPELEITFNADKTLVLELIEQDTYARRIVAEMMILYNRLTAELCIQHQVPVLYRTQSEPSEKLPLDEKGYLYYVFQQRRKLSPLHIQTSPAPHSGLGVSAYTHATSPIRRYLDLVTQHQLKAFLFGKPVPYDEKMLEELRLYVEPAVKHVALIKRNRLRYWTLKYLGQQKGGQLKAIVLDELKNKYRILLEDFLLIADLKRQNGIILSPGQRIQVRIKKAEPWDDILTLEYVAAS